MQHAPWTVRSADWPVTSKMTLALIAKDIGTSWSYFESLASVRTNKRQKRTAQPNSWKKVEAAGAIRIHSEL